MKFILKIMALVFALIFIECSHKLFDSTAQVSFVSKTDEGTVTLRSTGIGKNLLDARENSEINAFKIILIRGIPSSEISSPLLEDETKIDTKAAQVLDDFFKLKKFKTFLLSTSEGINIRKEKHKVLADFTLKVNINSLRRFLEQNNVIRRFGY